MITAAGALVVAYFTEDGGTLSAASAEAQYGDEIRERIEASKIREPGGWSFSVVDALDALGLRPLMRIEVQEINSEHMLDGIGPLTDDTTGEVI